MTPAEQRHLLALHAQAGALLTQIEAMLEQQVLPETPMSDTERAESGMPKTFMDRAVTHRPPPREKKVAEG